ncbi:MAG: invasion associated locus B family protein [Paracoccaceae bacterium]
MMSNLVKLIGVSALMLGTSMAWAQDSTQDAPQAAPIEGEAAAEDAPVVDGNNANGLSTGTPVSDGPQVGQTYVAETFQDWEVRCVRADGGKDPCQLYQLLKDADGNSVAEFSMFNLPEGGQAVAGATIITPLETLLTAELRLSVDGGSAKRYPYSFCSGIGCFSRVGFTAEEVNQFKRGSAGKVVIVPAAAPDGTVELTVSLSGFTAGWNAVIAANAAE